MIDWVTAVVPCFSADPDKLNDGLICRIRPDGEYEWAKHVPISVVGSHDANMRVSYHPISKGSGYIGPALRIDGNPAKWLQGHNIFGSSDLSGLIYAVLERLVAILELQPDEQETDSWKRGMYHIYRVDCTEMWEFPTHADVLAWLNAAQFQSKSRHGKPIMTGGTLYFGKNSRRWSLKFYSKGEEVNRRDNPLPASLPFRNMLLEFADNKLRAELVLRRPQLEKLNINMAFIWKLETPKQQLLEHLATLDMADQFLLTTKQIDGLLPRLQLAYKSWQRGEDLRSMFGKSTFYRYRREMLKHGIDISASCEDRQEKKMALREIFKNEPAQIPEWAIRTEILFQPLLSESSVGDSGHDAMAMGEPHGRPSHAPGAASSECGHSNTAL
ncbi:MAG: hypothetical protein HY751_13785 [Nitrospinae bacterium]|nr:hypothetical protein [Nitrospinota bacterium]